jgi:myo-inositol-1(or 4)-monophosphatase
MISEELLTAVKRAGDVLVQYFEHRENLQVQQKSASVTDVVTQADVASEKILFEAIRRAYPQDSIQGEEGSSHYGSAAVWHIDPLDGTSNFVRGVPLFAISVGRSVRGVPDMGIIYLPTVHKLFVARKGVGATCNGKPLHVSNKTIDRATLFTAIYKHDERYHHPENLLRAVGSLRSFGSSAWELALIASGDAEIYCLRNVPHDVVAGIVLVEEAGGKVTDKEGNAYRTDCEYVVVTNGMTHDAVLGCLAGSPALKGQAPVLYPQTSQQNEYLVHTNQRT